VRDETILALGLLYRHGRPLDDQHPEVIALSTLLRNAALVPAELRQANFRNPDGVALKMQNLRSALDPERRLRSSRMDRQIVEEFPPGAAVELASLAEVVRSQIEIGGPSPQHVPGDDVEEFPEGRLLTRIHRVRERDPKLRRRLLATREGTTLACDACGFSRPRLERSWQESLFEAHHLIPLAEAAARRTRLSDMALLCACCHRLIHRIAIERRQWVQPQELRKALGA